MSGDKEKPERRVFLRTPARKGRSSFLFLVVYQRGWRSREIRIQEPVKPELTEHDWKLIVDQVRRYEKSRQMDLIL